MNWTSSIRASEQTIRHETVEEFLSRGGKITKCPAKRALQSLEGALVVDGETFSIIPGGTEAIPAMTRATVEQYDRGMSEAVRPYHHLAHHDIAREAAPRAVRRQWASRDGRAEDADWTDYAAQE